MKSALVLIRCAALAQVALAGMGEFAMLQRWRLQAWLGRRLR